MRGFQFNKDFAPNLLVALFLLTVNVTAKFHEEIEDQHTTYHTICSDPSTVDVTGPGIISSPGYSYGRNYPPNMNCGIQLRIPQNKNLKISFSSFNLEKSARCYYDRLIISRQTSGGLSEIYQFCGPEKPADLIIEGPSIIIQFVSDRLGEFNGFQLSYIITEDKEYIEIDPSCPKRKIVNVIKSGIITSPGFEKGRYPPNKNCEYVLRIPANKILKITFSSFSLETSIVCFDSLTIYRKTSSLYQIGKWCGNKTPNNIFLEGPEILIQFKSYQRVQQRGSRLNYSITEQHLQGCGNRQVAFQSDVFNGDAVRSTLKWPWVVSLYNGRKDFCAGAILNKNWILTAAHCIRNMFHFLSLAIRAGNPKITDAMTIEVDEIFRHPKFNFILTGDIALIRLKTPLIMSDTIQPICFEDFDRESIQNCYTAGWGRRGPGYAYSEDLYEAQVDIWDDYSCKRRLKKIYRNTMICAGGYVTACRVNSGSPLMCSDHSGSRWSVVGVTSLGRDCGHPFNVPVYTNVSAYGYWIQQVMNNYPENYPKCPLDYPSQCNPNNFQEKSDQSLGLPEFFCNFNNANSCNYLLEESAKWTIRSDPLNPKNLYLFISNPSGIKTHIHSPRFNNNGGTGSVCLSFIYKIQSQDTATISILLDTISSGKNIIWISKTTGQWKKFQVNISDHLISKFAFLLYSIDKAVFSLDNIALMDGNCQQQ